MADGVTITWWTVTIENIHSYILEFYILNEFQGCLNMSYMQSIGYATLAKLDPQYGLCK